LNAIMLGIVIAAVLVVIVVRAIRRRHQTLFADRHLVDAAIGVAGIRRAAISNIEDVARARTMRLDDARHWVTDKKLVLVHRITRDGANFSHTCSVSLAGGETPHAVGSVFMALFVHLFGIAADGLEVHITPKGRYHLGFNLSEAQQESFATKQLPLPGFADAADLRQELVALGQKIHFRKVHIRT
jgi:hypothetical protein